MILLRNKDGTVMRLGELVRGEAAFVVEVSPGLTGLKTWTKLQFTDEGKAADCFWDYVGRSIDNDK